MLVQKMNDNILPDPKSWLDPYGTLLQTEDPEWIYRALTKEGMQLLDYIKERVGFSKLRDFGYIYTEELNENIDHNKFKTIVRHKRVKPVIYPQEWTMKMWKDALGLFCDLNIKLREVGLSLHDAHPLNILFDNGKPTFIDFSSLRILSSNMNIPLHWHIEFKKYFILPLLVHNLGFKKLAESVIQEPNHGTFKQYYYFTPFVIPMLLIDLLYVTGYLTKKWSIYFKAVKFLSRINIVPPIKTQWTSYSSSIGNWKEKAVQEAILECEPFSSIFDIGGNKGTYTYSWAKKGKQVTVADIDEPSLDALRKKAHAEDIPLSTIKLNICHPTPRLGLGLLKDNAFDRYASDVVAALALSHHLAFFNKLPFHAFANMIQHFSNKFIITEYVALTDPHVAKWLRKKRKYPTPYSREYFLESFENESFTPVREWVNENRTRHIFLFKKNE